MHGLIAVSLLSGLTMSAAVPENVTFCKDVAPILYKHCVSCHRPGEVGPFPLMTYQDASKRARFISEITSSRRMPPWKAEPNVHRFMDERRLSSDELAILSKWAETGAKEGDRKDLPEMPKFVTGWQLGKPDLIVKIPRPFTVPASGPDIHRSFVIPLNLSEDKNVSAVEFRPGNARVTHHSILYLDNLGQGRRKDPKGEGYTTFGGPGIIPTGSLGGWAPGATPRFLPDGMGLYLEKGSDLVLQMHYHPSGKEEQDQSQVGIYFTKKPAEKIVAGLALINRRFNIPAGARSYEITAESDRMPVDVQLIGIAPHMHLIGREMEVNAFLPSGEKMPLIHIKDWDFNWQGSYQYQKPVILPKGTVVKLRAVYDNSSDNPLNPNNPPKPVRWGEQTTDEMCLLGLRITTENRADLKAISRIQGARLGAGIMGGYPKD